MDLLIGAFNCLKEHLVLLSAFPMGSYNLDKSKLKRMLGCSLSRLVTGRLKIHRHKEIKLNITLGCSIFKSLELIKADKCVLRLVTGRLKIHRHKEIKLKHNVRL